MWQGEWHTGGTRLRQFPHRNSEEIALRRDPFGILDLRAQFNRDRERGPIGQPLEVHEGFRVGAIDDDRLLLIAVVQELLDSLVDAVGVTDEDRVPTLDDVFQAPPHRRRDLRDSPGSCNEDSCRRHCLLRVRVRVNATMPRQMDSPNSELGPIERAPEPLGRKVMYEHAVA